MGFGVWGLGFGVWGLGSGVEGWGLGAGLWVRGPGFRVYDLIRRGDPAYSIVVPDERHAENNLHKRDS